MAPTNGWFLTDAQLVDIYKSVEEGDIYKRRAVLGDSLLSIYEERLDDLDHIARRQQELIDDYDKLKSPGVVRQATDTGTLLAIAILGGLYIINDQ